MATATYWGQIFHPGFQSSSIGCETGIEQKSMQKVNSVTSALSKAGLIVSRLSTDSTEGGQGHTTIKLV
jgi:hypothetical protein